MKHRLKGWPIGWIVLAIVCGLGLMSFRVGLARLEQRTSGPGVTVYAGENEGLPKTENDLTNRVGTEKQKEVEKQGEMGRSVKDFLSPVQAEPLRTVGNYFSENLNAYLYHAGTDYPQPEGAVIRATHEGKVTYAGADPILGQKVEMDCGDNWRVVYGSLDNLRVHTGDIVEKNAILGQIGYYAGAEADDDRTQLHYEIWHGEDAQVP